LFYFPGKLTFDARFFKGRKLNQLRKESVWRGALIDRAYIVNIPFLVLKDFD
jgi:hypothetical protein